ncbi:MAG: adenosylmethionine--8-amino-7-oxononanoate transaminase [Spirochaetales bacterium]|nr:adenosylmethionine--8-amino-7-oxononanoate transaminase [Spirochaetales bacterium]
MNKMELLNEDKKRLWHPCSQMKDYEAYPARLIERAEGVWLYEAGGRRILDAVSSWWCKIFGHGNPHIRARINEQLEKLEHVIFANYTHEPAIELAQRLGGLFSDRLPRVFYTDNGSSAVEAALKISFQYWRNRGRPERNLFVHIRGAYHGETVGALSVGSLGLYRDTFKPLLFKAVEAEGPDCYRCPFGLNRTTCDAECFTSMENALEENNGHVGAVIIEPVLQAANGMALYSPRYLVKLSDACRRSGVHLIFDEIASGMGRTGKMMACDHASIVPDIALVSKALTGGFLSLAAVLTNGEIYDAFYTDYTESKAFLHSHTYTGNPLACAAACGVFDLFDDPSVLPGVLETGSLIRDKALAIADHPHVGEVRSLGMVTAIELVADKRAKEPYAWKERTGYRVYRKAERDGVLLRNLGDVLYFFPPYIINGGEIDFMVETAINAVKYVAGK